jgi:hypothetical protein
VGEVITLCNTRVVIIRIDGKTNKQTGMPCRSYRAIINVQHDCAASVKSLGQYMWRRHHTMEESYGICVSGRVKVPCPSMQPGESRPMHILPILSCCLLWSLSSILMGCHLRSSWAGTSPAFPPCLSCSCTQQVRSHLLPVAGAGSRHAGFWECCLV